MREKKTFTLVKVRKKTLVLSFLILVASFSYTVFAGTTPPGPGIANLTGGAGTIPYVGFASPPFTLQAHSYSCNQGGGGPAGTNCPTITAGVMNTTTNNMKQVSYTGPYNSNGFTGVEEYCGCTPTDVGYNFYSVQEIENKLTLNATMDYSIEQTFWFYFPTGQTGTNCGTQYTNAHWFDVEVFMARNASSGITPNYPSPGWDYNGCGSTTPTTITYREVWNQSVRGQAITWKNFAIRAPASNNVPGFQSNLLARGLAFQGLPLNTQTVFAGVEIGTENFGAIVGSTWLKYSLAVSLPGADVFNDPNGSLTMTQPLPFMPYNGTDNAQTDTMTFDVQGIESLQPPSGVVFTVTTSASLAVVFVGAKPTVICTFCTNSYAGNRETISYAGSVSSDALTVIWTVLPVSFPVEQPKVLIDDDFLTGTLADQGWTLDTYNSPSSPTGEYTSSGFLVMQAASTSTVESVHFSKFPAFDPSQYTGQTIAVKRKLTFSLYPFQQKVASGTASLHLGFSSLFSSGAYPGSTPQNTPTAQAPFVSCTVSPTASDNVGLEYFHIDNTGYIEADLCGDPSGTKSGFAIETVDPTLYTVFTVETYGVICSTCTDNVLQGTAWVWFRVYQIDANNNVVANTDRTLNVTAAVAPYFQRNYVFMSQYSTDGRAVSYIDLVQMQNYGSPICLFGCIPPLNLQGLNPFSSIWATLVSFCLWIGNGDLSFGAFLLFALLNGIVLGATYGVGRKFEGTPTLVLVTEFMMISAIFLTSGLMGTVWLFAILSVDAIVALFTFRSIFFSGSRGGTSVEV